MARGGGFPGNQKTPLDTPLTSRVPVEGKSSVCLICMKYRLLFLIIIIISLVSWHWGGEPPAALTCDIKISA